MRVISQILVASILLATRSQALPNPAATYSVVDVDGGQAGHNSMPVQVPTTVYRTITASAAPPTTVSVTVTAYETTTASAEPVITTITMYETESYTVTMSVDSELSSSSNLPASSAILSPTTTSQWTSSIIATSSPSEITMTTTTSALSEETTPLSVVIATEVLESIVVLTSTTTESASPTSTAYYDNGMWHTSYPVKPTWSMMYAEAPSSTISSSVATGSISPSASMLGRRGQIKRRGTS